MRRYLTGLLSLSLLAVGYVQAQSGDRANEAPHCVILDDSSVPLIRASVGIVSEEQVEGYGKTAFYELEAGWAFAYFRDVLYGDIDLTLLWQGSIVSDSAGLELPNQVGGMSVDAGWTMRTTGGSAIQLRLKPGFYSDIEQIGGGAFYVPFSLAFIQSFSDQVSGIAGAEIRPRFDLPVMPLLGLTWQPSDCFRLEATVPESRMEWGVAEFWTVYWAFEWINTSYTLREKGNFDRKQMTLEDFRTYIGAEYEVSDNIRIYGDLGTVFNRSISFERNPEERPGDVDIDNGVLLRFGIMGPF